ncbi:uncharacterized protein LOC100830388 [Brachypodium distachyon]|uniref:Bifunctional inhibitor/plant lipid transfer protein/seed storage helical domain-containing protein n=1 Tax=Brachypodium distachyon TaxID=15368 RepID=I1IX70_BRADI|nr:uncharacterized protein LOC100830388 [Brachypodium distachyon]PNT60939.1 hypothetical protein BRADI_5g08430v3 [Brachypodium distachyon]|eukprot:XP_003581153.1 uncharacterized protein LOC100830388 [Brachypodium distachyon]
MGAGRAFALRLLVLASILGLAVLAAGEKDCYDERDHIMRVCKFSIRKQGPYVIPDLQCRREMHKVDMPCICRVLTAADERQVSPEKLVRCARDAGVVLPVGSKCGTYTIVPPPPATRPRA